MLNRLKSLQVLYLIIFMISLLTMIQACRHEAEQNHDSGMKPTYTGSASCKSCHQEAYNDWLTSDHFRAMEPATSETVLGDFQDVVFEADGVINTFYIKDGKYFIRTRESDGREQDFEIKYTFGYYPLQQYLVELPGGRMQATRASWDSRTKKWFHQYAGQTIAHWDWLHWTGNAQNWNTMCASCHSTNLVKNYDDATDTYNTTWDEINVSCESCHGPGSQHIAFMNSKSFQKGKRIPNAGFWYGRDTIASLQINACASCHARKSDVTSSWQPSDELMDNLIPQIISNDFYFADGQIRDEVYEYGSFTQSKMYAHNVRCSSCHNPHSGKLRGEGNNLCLSCHKPEYATSRHHFHQEQTEASLCVNCHMVPRTYMGNDHRRDHSFRVPRPDQTEQYGTPNACNQCHQDKSSSWAANAVRQWYGPQRKYHFSDDLIPGSLLDDQSEGHLIKLVADTTQPEIARATAAYYLGQLPTRSAMEALMKAAKDVRPHVRYRAIRALESYPYEWWQHQVKALLQDPVKAVRIAVADLYHRAGIESLPAPDNETFGKASEENLAFLKGQTDFAIGNIMLADYYLQGGSNREAIQYYRKGLKKDSLMNYARLNLATALSSEGLQQEAFDALQDAARIDPKNDRVFYHLGLLSHEMGDIAGACDYFNEAVQLGSTNPGLYYNYGLALEGRGLTKEAEDILLKGYALYPGATNILYALAYHYANQRKPEQALQYAAILKQIDPENPEYRTLFNTLGL